MRWRRALPQAALEVQEPSQQENDTAEPPEADKDETRNQQGPSQDQKEAQRQSSIRKTATAEIDHYIKYCIVPDLSNSAAMIKILDPILKVLPTIPETRVYWYDPSMLAEPSEAFTKSHSVYQRCSPMNRVHFDASVKTFQAQLRSNDSRDVA